MEDTKDIVQRLRKEIEIETAAQSTRASLLRDVALEAADELERLQDLVTAWRQRCRAGRCPALSSIVEELGSG